MKHAYLLVMASALAVAPAMGQQQVEIGRMLLGSGEPGQAGNEPATPIYNNVFHAPQYLPGSPTAASIWPRVIEVNCRQAGARLECDGYNWTPRMGRGEYLYFMPTVNGKPVAMAPDAGADVAQAPLALVAAESLSLSGTPERPERKNPGHEESQ
jgi:hypothetical protein